MSFRSALIAAVTANKPYKRRLEYLESTGTQYINTGIKPTAATVVKTRLIFTRTSAGITALGCRNGNSTVSATNKFCFTATEPKYLPGYGSQSEFIIPASATPDDLTLELGQTTKINSLTRNWNEETFTSEYDIYLFAVNTSGTATTSAVRTYPTQIWQGTVLVQNLIPVIDLNDVACMYDEVTGAFFYTPSGTFLHN